MEVEQEISAIERLDHYVSTMMHDCKCTQEEAINALRMTDGDVEAAMAYIRVDRDEKRPGYMESIMCSECGCTPGEAHQTLERTNGDIVSAIILIELKNRAIMMS